MKNYVIVAIIIILIIIGVVWFKMKNPATPVVPEEEVLTTEPATTETPAGEEMTPAETPAETTETPAAQ
ncbi:MAG: hypothetical protein WC531_03705 [Candidatus Paceibacterota bacterium]|jgi:beta-lactam-binding protein with PASTA domain